MNHNEDQKTEKIVANLLRIGVLVSAFVVFLGSILYLIHYGSDKPEYGIFHGEPSDLRNISGILKDALVFRRRGLIQLGLLLLIATPIARVVFSMIVFLKQRDFQYVIITLIVFALLLFSIFGGSL